MHMSEEEQKSWGEVFNLPVVHYQGGLRDVQAVHPRPSSPPEQQQSVLVVLVVVIATGAGSGTSTFEL